jgi:invasion protein IalB
MASVRHAASARRGLCALSAVVLALAAAGAPPTHAQGVVKSVHGDWQIRCDLPPGAQTEQCALIQSVTAEDRANVGLSVIVLKTADQKTRLLRVLAPLGVLLPSGLGLKIDQTDIGRAGFVRCLPNGCVAEVVMDDNLIRQLRTGQSATFIIFQTPEEGIGIPLALKGFGEGYDKLP